MAGSINKVFLLGRLGADPEVRTFQNGSKVCNLRVATTETWKDRDTQEKRESTQWHTVTIWAAGAIDFVSTYLKKGSLVHIEGKLETRKWQDQGGNDRWTTEVTVRPLNGSVTSLDPKPAGQIGQGGEDPFDSNFGRE